VPCACAGLARGRGAPASSSDTSSGTSSSSSPLAFALGLGLAGLGAGGGAGVGGGAGAALLPAAPPPRSSTAPLRPASESRGAAPPMPFAPPLPSFSFSLLRKPEPERHGIRHSLSAASTHRGPPTRPARATHAAGLPRGPRYRDPAPQRAAERVGPSSERRPRPCAARPRGALCVRTWLQRRLRLGLGLLGLGLALAAAAVAALPAVRRSLQAGRVAVSPGALGAIVAVNQTRNRAVFGVRVRHRAGTRASD
jgi:hypothetical protein